MYSEKLETLIDAIIADGEIDETELAVLRRTAEKEGEDPDELEIIVKGRLRKMQKQSTIPSVPTMTPNKGISEMSTSLKDLVDVTLADGVLTDQEKMVLCKRAQQEGVDINELDVYIQSVLHKRREEQEKLQAIEDSKKKLGTVKECPNCGAHIQDGYAACPSCGYAFNVERLDSDPLVYLQNSLSEVDKRYAAARDQLSERRVKVQLSNNSVADHTSDSTLHSIVKMLSDQTSDVADRFDEDDLDMQYYSEKKSIIENLAVPNTRGHLLSILAFAKPKVDKFASKSCYGGELGYAYWTLFQNCINMANLSFKNDESFAPYFNFYEEELARQSTMQKVLAGATDGLVSAGNAMKSFFGKLGKKRQ